MKSDITFLYTTKWQKEGQEEITGKKLGFVFNFSFLSPKQCKCIICNLLFIHKVEFSIFSAHL
jgi:hypothetical protein